MLFFLIKLTKREAFRPLFLMEGEGCLSIVVYLNKIDKERGLSTIVFNGRGEMSVDRCLFK